MHFVLQQCMEGCQQLHLVGPAYSNASCMSCIFQRLLHVSAVLQLHLVGPALPATLMLYLRRYLPLLHFSYLPSTTCPLQDCGAPGVVGAVPAGR